MHYIKITTSGFIPYINMYGPVLSGIKVNDSILEQLKKANIQFEVIQESPKAAVIKMEEPVKEEETLTGEELLDDSAKQSTDENSEEGQADNTQEESSEEEVTGEEDSSEEEEVTGEEESEEDSGDENVEYTLEELNAMKRGQVREYLTSKGIEFDEADSKKELIAKLGL